ncbi:MAG: protein-export chaperone SecB [Shimia sp.]
MADETPTQEDAAAAAASQQPKVNMRVLGQYVRDLSFENVLVQKGASGDVQPEVDVQVALDAKKRAGDNQYESIIKLTVTSKSKSDGSVLFVLELEYGGLFFIDGLANEQIHPFLMIECPRMLFPFLRRVVSDVTRDGGFPALNLETIDFMALYRKELQKRIAEQQGGQAGETAQVN